VTARDTRPGDGPLYLDIRFRTRSSGATPNSTHVIKEYGGLHPDNSTPAIPPLRLDTVIKLDTFQKGRRY